MAAVSLASLVSVVTQPSALATELTIATALGLPVTAWQPVGVASTILGINAQVVANYSATINLIAQGGYASYAALMVDAFGNPITTWMDLRCIDQYNVTRIPATQASVSSLGFSVTNHSGSTIGPYAAGTQHYVNPTTGTTYHNTSAVGSILNNATLGVAITADLAGSSGSSGPGAISQLATPVIGVSCTNSLSVIGTDAESNSAYLVRCQAKLGALSPNGPSQAYYFVATSMLDPTQQWYNASVSAPVTRVTSVSAPAQVTSYLANASGGLGTTDSALVASAIQAFVVPLGTTATTLGATNVVIPVTYTAYIPGSASVTSAALTSQIATALGNYFATLPIGGLNDATLGVVPWSAILAVIKTANPAITSVTLTFPTGDTALTKTQVAVLGTIAATIVATS